MSIQLTWTDTNYGETEHRVYRDTVTIDPEALPAPLATLGPDVESYQDDTAAPATTYYYRVSAVCQGQENVSDEVSITTAA